MQNISIEKQKLIENEVDSDETLKWIGEPEPSGSGLNNRESIVYGMFFILGPIYFLYSAFTGSIHYDGTEGAITMTICIIIGIYFLLSGLLVIPVLLFHNPLLKCVTYVVTSKRIFTLSKGKKKVRVRSMAIEEIKRIKKKEKRNGCSNFTFLKEEPEQEVDNETQEKPIMFVFIPGSASLEAIFSQIPFIEE